MTETREQRMMNQYIITEEELDKLAVRVSQKTWDDSHYKLYHAIRNRPYIQQQALPKEVSDEIKMYLRNTINGIPLLIAFGGMPNLKKYIESLQEDCIR